MAGITNEYSNLLLNFLAGSEDYLSNILSAGLLFKSGGADSFSFGIESLDELPAGVDGYAREELVSAAGFGSAANGSIVSTGQVTFGPATADWGQIDGVGIYTATGVLAWFAYFDEPVTIVSGDTLQAGPFTLTLD